MKTSSHHNHHHHHDEGDDDDDQHQQQRERRCQLLRVTAATLFALAAQQGVSDAEEALERLVGYEVALEKIDNDESFLSSPVVQVVNAALAAAM